MSKNQPKKLGKITIPPLGVKVGYSNELTLKDNKNLKITIVGKIIDIIGPVKDPFVVVKVDKGIDHSSLKTDNIFYYVDDRKDRKKKKYSKRTSKGKRNKK